MERRKNHRGHRERGTQTRGMSVRIRYNPAPVVQQFIEDPTFITGYFGPLGCGKTTAGAMKAWAYGQDFPGARIAVIRDTWPNLRDTTQKTFLEWFPEGVVGHYHHTSKTYFLKTPSGKPIEILFRAMDDKKDISNVLSLDLAAAWIDEPQGGLALRGESLTSEPGIDHELFLSVLARCGRQTGYPGMCWLTGNPPASSHWIGREFGYKGSGAPTNPNPEYRLYLGDQATNRQNLPVGYYERLERLFGVGTPMARRFLKGEWIEFAQLNPFQAGWIHYWEERPKLEDLYTVIGVDPAISKKDEAAKTAMVAVAQARRGADRMTAFVLKAIQGHWTPYDQANRILQLVEELKPRKIRIEDVAWQRALGDIVKREAGIQGIRLPFIEEAKPEGDKLRRALRASPLVESGSVLFGPGQGELIEALLSVPHNKAGWDYTDAFGLALEGLPRGRAERSELRELEESPAVKRARSYAVRRERPPDEPIPLHTRPARSVGLEALAEVNRKRAKSYGWKRV